MGKNVRDTNGEHGEFTVTNLSAALSLNCDANSDLATADTLGTLIKILIEKGVISGTVS